MTITQNENLKPYNTFGLEAKPKGIIHILHENDIFEILYQQLSPLKILGGGSNILLTGDVDAFILKNEIKGIEIIDEDENQAIVQVGAGESWHQLVLWSLSHGLAGLENLSLIPGSVGAAPMQNIGAYGVEQEKSFHSLKAIHLESGVRHTFYKEECKFGYRESIFKNELKDQYFITHVRYILKKKDFQLYLDYGAISDVLKEKGIHNPGLTDVSDAVIEIRKSKLPDPKVIGNAGSFFKNPVIDKDHYVQLKSQFADLPSYPVDDQFVKVPAGWLIERCGLKGIKQGNIGVHKMQALVLVNYGGGHGQDIWNLALNIQQKVKEMFQIDIIPEVNIW
jgi:UDP-N-acetylmuramate dehydrogenase